jgi:hypothetical protein
MSQSDLLGRIETEPLVRGPEGALRAFEDGHWVKSSCATLSCRFNLTVPKGGCDLLVRDSDRPIVEVEAYAPAKGVREIYQRQLVDRWDALVSDNAIDSFDPASTPEHISLSPNAIVDTRRLLQAWKLRLQATAAGRRS